MFIEQRELLTMLKQFTSDSFPNVGSWSERDTENWLGEYLKEKTMVNLVYKEENVNDALLVLDINGTTIEIAAQNKETGLTLEYEQVYTERSK